MASYAPAVPRALRAARPAAPAPRQWSSLDGGASPVIQPKLEVGPSSDRFEAEADRVAQSILSGGGPSSPPAISPLSTPSAARKPVQREEQRPIAAREQDKTRQRQQAKGLDQILQPKSDTRSSIKEDDTVKGAGKRAQKKASPITKPPDDHKQAQKKPLAGVAIQPKTEGKPRDETRKAQRRADPRPREDESKRGQKKSLDGASLQTKAKPREDHQNAQKKGMGGPTLQPKANPRPEEDKTVQKKGLATARMKADPRPRQDEARKGQRKPIPGARVQAKAEPNKDDKKKGQRKSLPGTSVQAKSASMKPDDKKVQKKGLSGTLQRDDVDDDTINETSLEGAAQAKFVDGAMQRNVVKAATSLAPEQKEEPKKTAAATAQRDSQAAGGFTAPSSVEAGISSMQGGGQPLAPDVRSDLEPRFGRDLSGVRIHSSSRAAELSNSVQARAFTIGQDVFFGPNQFQPATSGGRALLCHELTHTIQQRGGSSRAQPARIQRADKEGAAANSKIGGTPDISPGSTPQEDATFDGPTGQIIVGPNRKLIKMKQLGLPKVGKPAIHKGVGGTAQPGIQFSAEKKTWTFGGKTARKGISARQQWLTAVATTDKDRAEKIRNMDNVKSSNITAKNGEKVAYLTSTNQSASAQNFLLIGTPTDLSSDPLMRIPTWDKEGKSALFDVDHIHELQLGGLDGIDNFWLLDQGSNRSSGVRIYNSMKKDFGALVTAAAGQGAPKNKMGGKTAGKSKAADEGSAGAGASGNWFADHGVAEPKWDDIRAPRPQLPGNASSTPASAGGWQIEYASITELQLGKTADNSWWSKGEIEKGTHIEELRALSAKEIQSRGLQYAIGTNRLTANIYAQRNGGFFRTIEFTAEGKGKTKDHFAGAAGTGSGPSATNHFYKGFAVPDGGIQMATAAAGPDGKLITKLGNEKLAQDAEIATIKGTSFPAKKGKKTPLELKVRWAPEYGFGGYVPDRAINEFIGRLDIEGLSPIEVQEAGITPTGELFANGLIVTDKKLFPGLRIPIYLRGNEIGVSFPLPDLNLGPVHATDVAVDIGYKDGGFTLTGGAAIAVDHVGKGTIKATANSDPTIEGDFKFDMDFLKKPTAKFKYTFSNDKIELQFSAGVEKGKLPGVEGGHVEGNFSRDAISLTGTLDLAPPLQGSQIILGYTEKEGIVIAANDLPLPISKIPGITDAKLSAKASMNPDDGEWHVSGTGSATFSMPPASGTLSVGLDGDRLMITGTAGFQQAIASGSVTVTATNAQLDESGQPLPDKVSDKFSIWGAGSASLKFGILTGTAGLKLNPDGSVIIDGEIALPPTHEVFKKEEYKKELLHPPELEFPIWGVSVAGYGIGIFGFVDAKLDFDAFIGPGTLNDTKVKVTFALDKPEEAVVDGSASFVVPAGAGLTLDIGGGLKAEAAVGYVKGRIGLDARLGLDAEARADMLLHWTQMEGLSLAAKAHAEARPRFDVGVNASVTAGVDLWVTEVEHTWGPWHKKLGSFGPEMAVGVTVPIAWSEKSGLDFDVDKIEIQKPDIDFPAMMKDAFLELV